MNILKRIASFFGLSEAPKELQLNAPRARRQWRSIKQARRASLRELGIPAAKRHRVEYYRYNPKFFGID